MRHSNSKYLVVLGLSAAMISGCACGNNCRLARWVSAKPSQCLHASCLSRIGTLRNSNCQETTAQVCSCCVGVDGSQFSSDANSKATAEMKSITNGAKRNSTARPDSIFEIVEPESTEINDTAVEASTEKSPENFSMETSSRFRGHGDPESDPKTRSSKVIVSEELYTRSLKAREAKKQLEVENFSLADNSKTLKIAKQGAGNNGNLDLTLSSEKADEIPKRVKTPKTEKQSPVAGNQVADQNGSLNPASATKAKPTKSTPSVAAAVQGSLSVPAYLRHKSPIPNAINPPSTELVPLEQPVVLHADPMSKGNFLDAIVRRSQSRSNATTNLTQNSYADLSNVELTNFRPLPSTRLLSGQNIPVADLRESHSQLGSQYPSTQHSLTRLPSTSSTGVTMSQTSVSKLNWKSVPGNFEQRESELATIDGKVIFDSVANDRVRLRATPNQSEMWIPPVVSINLNTTNTGPTGASQLQADNAERLERLHQQLHYGTLPSYQYNPAMDVQVSESIRGLTVRPKESEGQTDTIDR